MHNTVLGLLKITLDLTLKPILLGFAPSSYLLECPDNANTCLLSCKDRNQGFMRCPAEEHGLQTHLRL